MTLGEQWAQLRGSLPDHQAEVMASHQGRPTTAEQNSSHGAPAAEVDHGASDAEKYGKAAGNGI